MLVNVFWKNKKPTPLMWQVEDDRGLVRKVERDTRVIGFIRDGITIEVDSQPDLDYLEEKYDDLRFVKV